MVCPFCENVCLAICFEGHIYKCPHCNTWADVKFLKKPAHKECQCEDCLNLKNEWLGLGHA